jgi:Predicted membrane protein
MLRSTKIILVSSLFVSAGVFATQAINNDATIDASTAKISLTQAINVAEQHTAGKATRADLEHHKGILSYDIEVLNGTKVFDVKVDAAKGTVISSNEDKRDEDDGEDKQD